MAKTRRRTKRLRAWVNVYELGRLGSASESRKEACGVFCGDAAEGDREAVPFIESRPGDVVLSREQVDAISKLLTHAAGVLADGLSEQARYPVRDALALLRGGR